MIILGIDPGTHRIGYGVIKKDGNTMSFLDGGLLEIKTEIPHSFQEAKKHLEKIIKKHQPERVGIEKLFVVKNQKTAMSVSEMRGVLLLTVVEQSLELFEFSPNEIKVSVCGDGSADKRAVTKMMKLILNIPEKTFIDDTWDALAIAYTTACQPQYLKSHI